MSQLDQQTIVEVQEPINSQNPLSEQQPQQAPTEQQVQSQDQQQMQFTQDSRIQYDFSQSAQHQQFLNLYDAYTNQNAQPISMPQNTNFTMQQASQMPNFSAPTSILSGIDTFDSFMKQIQNGVVTAFQSDNLDFIKSLSNRFIASQMLSNPQNQQIAFIDSMKVLDSTILASLLKGDQNANIHEELKNVNYVQCNTVDDIQELLKKVRNYQIQKRNTRLIMISVNDALNFKESNTKTFDTESIASLMKFKERLVALQETLKNFPCPVVLLCQKSAQPTEPLEQIDSTTEIPVDTLITCQTVETGKYHIKSMYSSVTEGETDIMME